MTDLRERIRAGELAAFADPTFQGGGSAFSKSLGGAPAIGGLILTWQMTKAGTMRGFGIEMHAYPEKEVLRKMRAVGEDE